MSLLDLGKKLLDAAKTGNTEEVRALMASGAPFTTDWLGTSPLHFGSRSGHIGTAEVLLRAGISRDARTKVDRTPLHAASQEGHVNIVELLLNYSADVDAKDMLKMTPLHWACEKGHTSVASLLVCHGADLDCVDKFNRTPVDIAYAKGRGDIISILQGSIENEQVVLDTEQETIGDGQLTTMVEKSSEEEVPSSTTELSLASRDAVVTSSGDQSSTSVLATLAALAEATAPINQTSNNTSAAEALSWLETHGITMSTNDSSSILASQLESGQTFTITEAGKLALNLVNKEQQGANTTEPKEISSSPQKVITWVANSGQQLKFVTRGSEDDTGVSPTKKIKLVAPANIDVAALLKSHSNGGDADNAKVKPQIIVVKQPTPSEANKFKRKIVETKTSTAS